MLQPAPDPLELTQAPRHGVGTQAGRGAHSDRGQRIADVVGAEKRQLERADRGAAPTDAKPGSRGAHVEIVRLPMPAPLWFNNWRLPASYANFYICNAAVIVPTFNDPNDRIALNTLAELFPDREVVGIHSVDLVWGLGTLHCLTQQEPARR